ncbi:signal transduction histidine kinase [Streptacidiphilus sp. MAP12-16]|uniref:nitrate- and nitrite sensing domain-containing protein n=1 Tax=Streptacidiphilus sp. MAP12-16 TaxID=3156300 RepID=UPI003515C430
MLRTGIVLAVALPSVLLSCLWGYTMATQLSDTLALRAQTQFAQRLGAPLHTLLARLQDERRLTAIWQADLHPADRAALDAERQQTDTAAKGFRMASSTVDGADQVSRAQVLILNRQLSQLTGQRAVIDSSRLTAAESFDYYKAFIAQGMVQADDLARIGDAQFGRSAAAAYIVVQVTERLAREDAEVSAALATGRMSAAVHTNFAAVAAARRDLLTSGNIQDLPTAAAFAKVVSSPAWANLGSIETAVIGGASTGITSTSAKASVKLPSAADGWRQAEDQVHTGLVGVLDQGWSQAIGAASNRVTSQVVAIGVSSAFFLATALCTVLVSRRLARQILRRLADLRQAARDLAEHRLPDLIERVNRGEPVDVRAELTPQDYGDDELGRTATEVTATQLAAVASAVQRARNSEGTRQVFVNLARRTQVLVHRQIAGLDDLERGTDDPKLLSRLFEVDHIATRIRRNAENLAILGGAPTARQWRTGVQLVNVVRSAVSEVEDYARVKVHPVPRTLLAGPAVTDVIHLLAELIENGTTFSPPHTRVTVTVEEVPSGCVIEIEDRGLGMDDEEYARFNQLLANPPEPGMILTGDDPRLGLYVVARLAHRHGVGVSLRKSPYGGSCAIVLLPTVLMEAMERDPSGPPGLFELPPENRVRTLPQQSARAESARAEPVHEQPMHEQPVPERDLQGAEAALVHASSGHTGGDRPASGALEQGAFSAGLERDRGRQGHAPDQTVGGRHAAPRRPVELPGGTPGTGSSERKHVEEGASQGQEPGEKAVPRVLPKRIKQASLARQMRETADVGDSQTDNEFDGPLPERSRSTMASIQSGTRRGREVTEPKSDSSSTGTATKEQR